MSHDKFRDQQPVAAFLRDLARRAEADPTLATQLRAALAESGLLDARPGEPSPPAKSRGRGAARAATSGSANTASEPPPPDPFAVYRTHGEDALRATLDTLELASLRAIIRSHRLDPARISARWTARDRLISLIVDQVRARYNHGRAFERV